MTSKHILPNSALLYSSNSSFFLKYKKLPSYPDFEIEHTLHSSGYQFIAGVDEVGRGPLAGPVVAAAVILDPKNIPDGLNDSKKLSGQKRKALFEEIIISSHVGVASLNASVIDQINIRNASLKAMQMALDALDIIPQCALIDGNIVPPKLKMPAFALIKGDARSQTIAAASIVAKIIRDNMMAKLDCQYPEYGFIRNKGYPTLNHRKSLDQFGACPAHRRSFKPVSQALQT